MKKSQSQYGLIAAVALALGAPSMVTPASAATELAKVNGTSITDKDLAAALSGLNEGQRANVLKDSNSKRQILDGLIDQTLLAQTAEKEKLDQDQDFKDALAAFKKQYLANKLLQKNLSAKITDAAAKKYYEVNKLRYSTDQVHAQHILVSDEKQARDLLKQAKAEGADFEALAEKNSKDPSAKNNRGDLGFFGRDRMVAEFTDAAFRAGEGEVVGPVKTSYGYHIIKVVQKKSGKPLEYGEVELRVKNDMRQELVSQYLSKLKTTAKVEYKDTKG
jgi:peptidyl-prolyl cis-trans isomerase C